MPETINHTEPAKDQSGKARAEVNSALGTDAPVPEKINHLCTRGSKVVRRGQMQTQSDEA